MNSASAEESQTTLWFITRIYEDLIAYSDQHQVTIHKDEPQ
jgi:hypothetical protein